jgi:hypothetical protein
MNEETKEAEELTQALANVPLAEKQQMGYQPSQFLLDCQYAGYSCNPAT